VRILRIALAVLLLAFAGELGLRIASRGWTRAVFAPWSTAPPWERIRRFGPDGAPEPIPGGDAAWALTRGEPVIRYRLNQFGLREERETTPWPRRDGCRVLAVGDAYTFGYGVAAPDTWPRRVERRLARRGRFEVLNGGFPNLNVEQQRRRLEMLLGHLHPDVVVATFDWWNVPVDDAHDGTAPRWSRAWWMANLDEKAARVAAHAALFDATLRVVRPHLAGIALPVSGLARELEPLMLPRDLLGLRWARTQAALSGMADDAAAAGARFLLVATPLDLQVDARRNGLYRTGRLPYPSQGFADIDYRAARAMPLALARFARDAGIDLVDLTPDFAAHGGGRLFLADDYHAAPAGQARIARAVARWIVGARPCSRGG
jgi:lysophospholipase L1-like esterase